MGFSTTNNKFSFVIFYSCRQNGKLLLIIHIKFDILIFHKQTMSEVLNESNESN